VNPSPQAVKEHCSWLVAGHDYVSADGPRGRRATPCSPHGALLVEVCRVDLAEVGATVAELIDTIEGCGDAAFRTEARRHCERSPSVVDLARVERKNVLLEPPAVDAHQRVAGLKLAERPCGVPPVRNLKIIT
jgi:hypothetical protein